MKCFLTIVLLVSTSVLPLVAGDKKINFLVEHGVVSPPSCATGTSLQNINAIIRITAFSVLPPSRPLTSTDIEHKDLCKKITPPNRIKKLKPYDKAKDPRSRPYAKGAWRSNKR